ncbi:MAG: helix-turn-helix domain-containing protein [Myxococcales bacterium]|nr:helix-turn-helix domain-containing protein [Myxococcales bacterium]
MNSSTRLLPTFRRLLTVANVSEQLGVCTATVYKLIDRGELPCIRVSNAIRIDPAELAAYLARRGGRR